MRLSDSTTGTIKVRVFRRFPAPILADSDFAQLLSAAHYTMELAEWNFAVNSHCSPDLLSLAFVFLYPFSLVRGSSLDLPHSAHPQAYRRRRVGAICIVRHPNCIYENTLLAARTPSEAWILRKVSSASWVTQVKLVLVPSIQSFDTRR